MTNKKVSVSKKRSSLERKTGRKPDGQFLALPRVVSSSVSFRGLSGTETKVFLMIATQYNGFNNGDLQATHGLAKKWGISSEHTLALALKALQDKDFIRKTRQGVFMNPGKKCSLYAITWRNIDDCNGKLDVEATRVPLRVFSMEKNK